MAAASLTIFILGANLLSGLLALGGLLVYVLVYTPAKRRTPASVVIGAVAGAAPPLVAWAAVTGSVNLDALLLFAIMASWQIPHTLALTLMLYNDYARARVPVSPVAQGLPATRRAIFGYSLWLWMLSLVPVIVGLSGWLYAVSALMLGGQFALLALNLLPGRYGSAVRADARLYKYSLLYLALLFTLMTVDRVLRAPRGI
jgi:heme o synthase